MEIPKIGNAVVPQQFYPVFDSIARIETMAPYEEKSQH